MRKFYVRAITVLAFLSLAISNVNAQCEPQSSAYWGEMLPNAGVFASYSPFGPGEYFRMPVLTGASYSISTCGNGLDTQITGFQEGNSTTSFMYNDDNGPECSGTASSIDFIPTFSDYANIVVKEYNCQLGGSASITVDVRQNNNLTFTSSSAGICAGDSLVLSATPAPVVSAQPNSGDWGTFSGANVVNGVFYAPVPAGDSAVYSITYTFGVCSTTQDITVYSSPSQADAGSDQLVCSPSATLAAVNPAIGEGMWSVVSGAGSVTYPSDSASNVTGLSSAAPTVLVWTVSNGTCTPTTDTVEISLVTIDTGVSDLGETLLAYSTTATYQWLDCDNGYAIIPGATSQSFTPTDTVGNYAVELTESGCVDTSACYLVDVTGLDEAIVESIELAIYPNPTDGRFTVEVITNANKVLELKIIDILGRVMVHEELLDLDGKFIRKIDISKEQSGTYFIQVIGEKGLLLTKKISKQ